MKILLNNVAILDATKDNILGSILIQDGIILSVNKIESKDVPMDTVVYDLTNCTALPGFFDSHVHVSFLDRQNEDMLSAFAQNGVCAVADMGICGRGSLESHMEFLSALDRCKYPHVITTGRYIDVPDGYGMGPEQGMNWGIQVKAAEDIEGAIEYQQRAGIKGVKTGISDGIVGMIREIMSPELMRHLAITARSNGLWSAAHIGRVNDLRKIVEAGISISAHTPGDKDMDEDLIELMVKKGVSMITTVGDMTDKHSAHIPKAYGTLEVFNKHREIMLKNLQRFHSAGGIILVGTDLMRSEDFTKDAVIPYYEMAHLRRLGIPMHDVIRCTTANPAKIFGMSRLGYIAEGMEANIVIIQGRLSDELAELESPPFVMNNGKVIKNHITGKEKYYQGMYNQYKYKEKGAKICIQ